MDIKLLYYIFQQNSDPIAAQWMYNYMRQQFNFYGIKQPLRRKLEKSFWQQYGYPPIENINQVIRELWLHDKREAQYTAMDLLDRYIKNLPQDFIEILEWLIITKPWWDTVDILAAKYVNLFFIQYPHQEERITNKWINSNNIWLQRTSIIYQLRRKENTNIHKLITAINKLKQSNEFFIQKAIGWALREYSKTNPEFVINFVNTTELPKLSRREALRYLNKKK